METFALLLLCFLVATVNGQIQVTDANGLGRRFDGIGGLSGGGATSKLLMAYKEPQRSQILDMLFKPKYGAALQILKVEIGGDAQSTDGSESSHMHEPNDENYNRGYEWWLMVEAKKRNPDILLYGLPWAFPGWVGDYGNSPYKNVTKTAWYVVKWIQGAKRVYNLAIDYIGIWNERSYNKEYIVTLRTLLNQNGFQSVKIIAVDGGMNDGEYHDILSTNSVWGIGVHYPGTHLDQAARMGSVPCWASEDYSTFNNDVGAGCWARILNQNYVNGNMTSTISWNLITGYYPALPYARNGLMDSQQPWSGNYVVQNPIWVSAHTTHFTSPGWTYTKQGSGSGLLPAGGSYVSLTKGNDFTMVIETMSHNHAICIRPSLPPYNTSPQDVTFTLGGSFAHIQKLHLYMSRFYFEGQASKPFMKMADVTVVNSQFRIHLDVDAVYTLSTIYSEGMQQPHNIPAPTAFPLPYMENFNSYTVDQEPGLLAQQDGAWEIVKMGAESFARQKTIHKQIQWCGTPGTHAVIGDNNWKGQDITVSIKERIPTTNGASSVFLALRMQGLGCSAGHDTGIYFWLKPNSATYTITYDINGHKVAKTGSLSAAIHFDTWYTVMLSVAGNALTAKVNTDVITMTVANGATSGGFVGIGSGDYGYSDWDDLSISYQTCTPQGKCFVLFYGSSLNWAAAQSMCRQMYPGGNLASLHSAFDQNIVYRFISISEVTTNLWLGASRATPNDPFKWSDGSNVDYNHYLTGGTAPGQGNCIQICENNQGGCSAGFWRAADCNAQAQFVCEYNQ